MKNTISTICFLLICLFLIASCKVKRPDAVLPESTMESLIYDYHIAKAMGDDVNFADNYKRAMYIEAVFNKYDVTEAQFDSSLVWYTRNTDILSKMYERVAVKLKTKQNQINQLVAIRDKKPLTSQPGDSIDVWAWKRLLHLSRLPLNNNFAFVLPSDTNFKERDEIIWNANFYFSKHKDTLLKDSIFPIMAMQIVYDNDSIISEMLTIDTNGPQTIALQSDTMGEIREIKGFIFYPHAKQTNTLLVDKISLMRYHSTDTLIISNDSILVDTLNINKEEISIDTISDEANAKEEIKEIEIRRTTPSEMRNQHTKTESASERSRKKPTRAINSEPIKIVQE